MADTLRTVTLSPGGRPIARVNLQDPLGLSLFTDRSTFTIVPPGKSQNWAASSRRYAGAVLAGESTENAGATASWWVTGANATAVLTTAEQVLAEVDDAAGLNPNQPKYLEWRPDGAAQSTLMELRGTGTYVPHYDRTPFVGANILKLDMTWPTAPLAIGLPMDIADPFDVDSRIDYTVDIGPALTYTAPTPSGAGGSVGVAGTPAESAFRHTTRGYSYDDVQVTAQIATGGSAPTSLGVTASCIDASNHLLVKISASGLQILKKDVGSYTVLATNATPVIAASTNYWLRIRVENNIIVGEMWTGSIPPGPLSAIQATIRFVLTGADAVKFGDGVAGGVGVRLESAPTTTLVQYFEALPYTFRAVRLPETVDLSQVPGSGPPLCDVQVTTVAPVAPATPTAVASGSGSFFLAGTYKYKVTALGEFGESLPSPEATVVVTAGQIVTLTFPGIAGAHAYNIYRTVGGGGTNTELLLTDLTHVTAPVGTTGNVTIVDTGLAAGTSIALPGAATVLAPQWSLLSWTQKARSWNRVWNGDFEVDAGGWTANTGPFLSGAGVSIVRDTVKPDSGLGHGKITVPATTNSGAQFTIYRRFRAGTTYTFTARLASPALTDSCTVELGVRIPGSQTNDVVAATASIGVNYTTYTGTWTPANDYDTVDLSVVHNTGVAGVIQVDAVQVYETGQGAPALPSQTFGRGAMPPFGLLDPGAAIPADMVGGGVNFEGGGFKGSPSGLVFFGSVPASGAGTSLIDWWIDPSLYATPDDFARGSIAVEVFYIGVASVSSPRVVISAIPDPAFSLGQERFTQEYGNVGRSLASQSLAGGIRPSRVGTIVLPVNPTTPVRWKLKATLVWSGPGLSQFDVRSLILAHSARRACSPTGKSRVDVSYPEWTTSTSQVIKTIRSSLRATAALAPTGSQPGQYALLPSLQGDDVGLSGSPLELQPPSPTSAGLVADHQMHVALSSLVPDDPTGEATVAGEETMATVHVAVTPRYRLTRFA